MLLSLLPVPLALKEPSYSVALFHVLIAQTTVSFAQWLLDAYIAIKASIELKLQSRYVTLALQDAPIALELDFAEYVRAELI